MLKIGIAQCGTNPVSGTTTISASNQIVNSYFPGTGNPTTGATTLTVGARDTRGNATTLSSGDLIIIIQMQGADINANNTDAYGDGVAGGNASGYLSNANAVAGYYEYNTVSNFSSGIITLTYSLLNNYYKRAFTTGTGSQSYQVIRVPRNYNLDITSAGSVTAPSWNGNTGGVVVLDAANVITINGTIDVSAKGFRGGGGKNFTGATTGTSLYNTDYRWNSPVTTAADLTGGAKGEGIAGTPIYILDNGATSTTTNSSLEGYVNGTMGRGAPGNAGGGGTDGAPVGTAQNQYNTGGGGGSNAGSGGNGGSGWHGGSGSVSTYPYGGFGGSVFSQAALSRIILGGGGGAGTANNSDASNEYQSSGGVGGGMIISRAKSYAGTGTVNANGGDAPGVVGVGGTSNTDAAGGGGAGGTILLVISQNGTPGLNGITANAKGGKGGDMTNYWDHGPGGGGGIIYANGSLSASNVTGGANGKTRTGSSSGPITNNFGATSGNNGTVITLSTAPLLSNRNNLSSPCGTLPVKLTQFYAVVKSNGVDVIWQIENAVNFDRFEVEYSLNARDFTKVGNVSYTSNRTSYNFLHTIITDVIYYRLKMVDINSSFDYSRIILVKMNRNATGMSIYPNPSSGVSTIQFKWNNTASGLIKINDATGKLVLTKTIQLQSGDVSTSIDIETLPDGFYTVSLETNRTIIAREKLLKVKNK